MGDLTCLFSREFVPLTLFNRLFVWQIQIRLVVESPCYACGPLKCTIELKQCWTTEVRLILMYLRNETQRNGKGSNDDSKYFNITWFIFPQNVLIFFLILTLRVGDLPTRESSGTLLMRNTFIKHSFQSTLILKCCIYTFFIVDIKLYFFRNWTPYALGSEN